MVSFFYSFLDTFLRLDIHVGGLIQRFGTTTYVLLFLVIFAETGLVVTPFLPGDSLLFAVGGFAAQGALEITSLFFVLCIAAIVGDSVNYAIGRRLGHWVIAKANGRFLKKEHIEKTQRFYEKHGAKTIVIARFIPIVRTFAPFVAGVGKMEYRRFFAYNVFGGGLWVALFLFGGYFFGNLPTVKENFSLVILAIIFVSILPGIVEYLLSKWKRRKVSVSHE